MCFQPFPIQSFIVLSLFDPACDWRASARRNGGEDVRRARASAPISFYQFPINPCIVHPFSLIVETGARQRAETVVNMSDGCAPARRNGGEYLRLARASAPKRW